MTTIRRMFLRNTAAGLAGAALVGERKMAAAAKTSKSPKTPKAKIRISARHFGSDLARSKKAEADCKRNAEFVRKLMGLQA